mmetsp:Transcript_16272/g.27087  ORF Transcript_16272/g.27087 Transcript_16272/m.27087 type:complete len:289 (-) Transcript_16272:45-911(-)
MSRLLLRSNSYRLIASRRVSSSPHYAASSLVNYLPSAQQHQRDDSNNESQLSSSSRYNHMMIRQFSVHNHHPDNDHRTYRDRGEEYRDRARKATQRAKDYSKPLAERGAIIAKKGAKTSLEKLRLYGPVFAGTYFVLYMGTIVGLYAGVDAGLIDPIQIMGYINGGEAESLEESKTTANLIIEYLEHYTLTRPAVPFLEKNPHFANLGVAWVATKFTEPVRLVVAMVVVPRLAKSLGLVPPELLEEEEAAAHAATEELEEVVVDEKAQVKSDDTDQVTKEAAAPQKTE